MTTNGILALRTPICFVIPSGARNLSSFDLGPRPREIPRFARNDKSWAPFPRPVRPLGSCLPESQNPQTEVCATLLTPLHKDRSEEELHDSRRTAPGGIPPAHQALEALGAVSRREAVGNGSRGLQSGRNRVGIFSARACTVARVSLGGRRHRRDLRPPSAGLLRAGALEWARSHPEGTLVRADGP